jgi:hypothetical protein
MCLSTAVYAASLLAASTASSGDSGKVPVSVPFCDNEVRDKPEVAADEGENIERRLHVWCGK